MAEVNANQLQAAIARLGPVRVRLSGTDDTTDAVILYPGTIAGRILQAVNGLREHLEPDHAAEAAQALTASTYSYQKWGEGASGAYKAAMWELERAKVHALLAIAQAASGPGRGQSDG